MKESNTELEKMLINFDIIIENKRNEQKEIIIKINSKENEIKNLNNEINIYNKKIGNLENINIKFINMKETLDNTINQL